MEESAKKRRATYQDVIDAPPHMIAKDGKRGGKMLFVIGETEFTNQRGEVVAYMRNTAIETSGAVAG